MATSGRRRRPALQMIGWREWLAFPDLGVPAIKAKIDTGARTSALHAINLRRVSRDGATWLRFDIHPLQRSTARTVSVEAEMIDERRVTDSGGKSENRPVIATEMELMGARWPIELTLTRRDEMGFRLLLGRQAVRNRFTVDPGKSFLAGVPSDLPTRKGSR